MMPRTKTCTPIGCHGFSVMNALVEAKKESHNKHLYFINNIKVQEHNKLAYKFGIV